MELKPLTATDSFLLWTLIPLSRHIRRGVIHTVDVLQISTSSSFRLKMILSRAMWIVLQGSYISPTTGHPSSSHSTHQKSSMEILLEVQCPLLSPLRSEDGYAICLAGLVKQSQNLIFPYIHWQ